MRNNKILNNEILPYNPGVLPSKPAPKQGEKIIIELEGYPPYKDKHFSMRNNRHSNYEAFVKLRKVGIKTMNGRAWSFGPIGLYITLYAPKFEKNKKLLDYISGIEDTLDGSSGYEFTYLPIVFEDDCQVCKLQSKFIESNDTKYKIEIEFLKIS